jgi:hypothetical protein
MKRLAFLALAFLLCCLIWAGNSSQRAAGNTDAVSPAWMLQEAYAGDCRERPAGTVCLGFSDGYIWLIPDSVLGRATSGDVEIAYGCEAEYWHKLNTSLVWLRTAQEGNSDQISEPSPLVLVDASRDGGTWWAPQTGPSFSPSSPHQGLALAAHLRSWDFQVAELPRSASPTNQATLSQARVVIRAGCHGTYSASELQAYLDYVREGGRLLLLSEYLRPGEYDLLSLVFGIVWVGTSQGDNILTFVDEQPIVAGVGSLQYRVGAGAVGWPTEALALGTLSSGTYLDLDGDTERDPSEPSGGVALGAMEYGKGRLVFCGDTNLFEDTAGFLLIDRVMDWLVGE